MCRPRIKILCTKNAIFNHNQSITRCMVPQSGRGMYNFLFRIIFTLLVSLFYSFDHFGTYKELIVSVVVEQTYTSTSDMTESIKSASIRHRSRWTKTPSARCVLSSRRFAAAHHCRRPSVDCTPVRLYKKIVSFCLERMPNSRATHLHAPRN